MRGVFCVVNMGVEKIYLVYTIYSLYICGMETIKKLVDIPVKTAQGLLLLASQESKPVFTKQLMERILVDYEKKANRPGSNNYRILNPQKRKSHSSKNKTVKK